MENNVLPKGARPLPCLFGFTALPIRAFSYVLRVHASLSLEG